jgi:hypothetical protein
MKQISILFFAIIFCQLGFTQKFETVKKQLEQINTNPIETCKKLKYTYRIDTIQISNITYFNSFQDSLCYRGKLGKVYGPYDNGKYAVQILLTAPNNYTRIKRINFDTSSMSKNLADTISNRVLKQITTKQRTFEEMALLYNKNEGFGTSGDLGFCARGTLQPALEKKIANTKVGGTFKYWSTQGVDLVKVVQKDKVDKGFALLLVVSLK